MAGISYPINLGLGDAPDQSLDPAVWVELNKLQLAAKYIAANLGTAYGGTNGLAGSSVTVQDYCRIKKIVNFNCPAGSVLEIGPLTCHLTSAAYPYPMAFAEVGGVSGSAVDLILYGMVYYAPGGLLPGMRYYLDLAVPGGISTTVNNKFIGQAFSPTNLFFDPVRG